MAKEHGYKGQKIAEYLWREMTSVIGYAREKKGFEPNFEKMDDMLYIRSGKFML